MGTQLPFPQTGTVPQFSARICCGQMTGWIKMPLGREVGLGPSDIVLDGESSSPKRGHSSPQFSAHVYCGEKAEWTKMPLATKVGLGLGHIVFDGDPLP